jgi:hypothetical protein
VGDQGQTEAPSQAEKTLLLLQKLVLNPIQHPDEDKYRRVRKSVPAVQTNVVVVPGASEILRLFGFAEVDPVPAATEAAFELPKGQDVHAGVVKAVERELLCVQGFYDGSKGLQWENLLKRERARAEADAEKFKILEQVRKDREERKQQEEITGGVHASKAVDRKFGADAHRVEARRDGLDQALSCIRGPARIRPWAISSFLSKNVNGSQQQQHKSERAR